MRRFRTSRDPRSAIGESRGRNICATPPARPSCLQEHLTRYPDSDRASTALYFLGRIAESKSDLGTARVYYEKTR